MFDFEKLDVYQVVKSLNVSVYLLINKNKSIDSYISDQWKRASLSSVLNLAEGVGRTSVNDKRHFITMARGSIFECVALLQLGKDLNLMDEEVYNQLYDEYEKASKMLLGMFRSYK